MKQHRVSTGIDANRCELVDRVKKKSKQHLRNYQILNEINTIYLIINSYHTPFTYVVNLTTANLMLIEVIVQL